MKIREIHIKNHQQFRDFKMDLTYPKGHDRAGQPLDKICLVGQSGTGKTSLLKLIKSYISSKEWTYVPNPSDQTEHSITIQMGRHQETLFSVRNDHDTYTTVPNRWDRNNPEDRAYNEVYKPWLLYFPAETIEQVSQVMAEDNENPLDFFATSAALEKRFADYKKRLAAKAVYDFSTHDSKDAWDAVLLKARAYRDQEIKQHVTISKLFMDDESKAKQAKTSFETWKAENPSPIEALAHSLDPFLKQFQVQIRTELDYERAEDLRFIQLRTTSQQNIPFTAWSTGTKQIILTATPIFSTNTEQTVIIMDEPERSLYPDIQRNLISYYQKIGRGAQFIFATHSPFIAASFAPWELFELEFDENGNTQVVPYFKGDRHVENYFDDPRYQRWDQISANHFGVQADGNPKRKEELLKLARLEEEILEIRSKKNPDKALWQEKWHQYKQAAERLNWEIEHAEN